MNNFTPPPSHCVACPRLAAFRAENTVRFPTYHNAPVPAFGGMDATHLVVGLAPGLHGANQTGRPFTNDYAGDTLYAALMRQDLAEGVYGKHADDGLTLHHTRITNAVRCVPPENKPTTAEINTCHNFLTQELQAMSNLRVILALGGIAHKAVIKAYGLKQSAHPFAHDATYALTDNVTLISSYHCSRYNTSTKRLTLAMFDAVVARFANA